MSDPAQGSSLLPPPSGGVAQEAIDAAIAQVERTGSAEGIAPEVLASACLQIEARARAQGIVLDAPASPPSPAPANYVDAAVMNRKDTLDAFIQQRVALKGAVAAQREAARQPYLNALGKAYGEPRPAQAAAHDYGERPTELASVLRDLDPQTIALLGAARAIAAHPTLLNGLVWLEVARILVLPRPAASQSQIS